MFTDGSGLSVDGVKSEPFVGLGTVTLVSLLPPDALGDPVTAFWHPVATSSKTAAVAAARILGSCTLPTPFVTHFTGRFVQVAAPYLDFAG
jgi:hypothetical protein